jgi:K+ transporter
MLEILFDMVVSALGVLLGEHLDKKSSRTIKIFISYFVLFAISIELYFLFAFADDFPKGGYIKYILLGLVTGIIGSSLLTFLHIIARFGGKSLEEKQK